MVLREPNSRDAAIMRRHREGCHPFGGSGGSKNFDLPPARLDQTARSKKFRDSVSAVTLAPGKSRLVSLLTGTRRGTCGHGKPGQTDDPDPGSGFSGLEPRLVCLPSVNDRHRRALHLRSFQPDVRPRLGLARALAAHRAAAGLRWVNWRGWFVHQSPLPQSLRLNPIRSHNGRQRLSAARPGAGPACAGFAGTSRAAQAR